MDCTAIGGVREEAGGELRGEELGRGARPSGVQGGGGVHREHPGRRVRGVQGLTTSEKLEKMGRRRRHKRDEKVCPVRILTPNTRSLTLVLALGIVPSLFLSPFSSPPTSSGDDAISARLSATAVSHLAASESADPGALEFTRPPLRGVELAHPRRGDHHSLRDRAVHLPPPSATARTPQHWSTSSHASHSFSSAGHHRQPNARCDSSRGGARRPPRRRGDTRR